MSKKPAAKKAGARVVKHAAAKASDKTSKSVLDAELSSDEKILWSHRPGAGAYALAHMRAAMVGMPFIMLSMLWNGMAAESLAVPYVGPIFTWLLAGLGVVYLCVPLVAYLRGKIYVFYALTNKRLIILSLFPKHQVQSFLIGSVSRVFTKDIQFGVGSLIIEAPGAKPKNPAKIPAGFYGVPYIARVEEAFNMLKNPEATRAAAAQQTRLQRAQQQAEQRQAQQAKETALTPSSAAQSPDASSSTMAAGE